MILPRHLVAAAALALLAGLAVAALVASCGGAESGPADAPTAAETSSQPESRVAREYHDEYGHGHCYVVELEGVEETILCQGGSDGQARLACFSPEEASGARNAMGILRVNGNGQLTKHEGWPERCAAALDVLAPGNDLNDQAQAAGA